MNKEHGDMIKRFTPSDAKRPLFLVLGWVFFALGAVGAFLPVLPTTVFMILALWAFTNSSPRLHAWLYEHPKYGPALQRWDQHRVIPVQAKIMAISCMLLSLLYMIIYSGAPYMAVYASATLIGIGAFYVLTKPSRPPSTSSKATKQENL